jgi:anti-sigma regulatory factor (Ser/Thr protein kinase)
MPDQPAGVLGRHPQTADLSHSEDQRGPGWRVFDATPRCGKEVRDWIASVIVQDDDLADPADVALVVSELFTNAVLHGPGGQVLVAHFLWRGGVRIAVCDGGGTSTPQLREPARSEEGGRGLQVVDMIAAAWGQFRVGSAQVVWCELGKPLDSVLSDPWSWLLAAIAGIGPSGPCSSSAEASDRIPITPQG